MNDLKVLEYLHKQILESSKDNVDFLADGGAKSFDEYRHVCGQGCNGSITVSRNMLL